MLGKDVHVPVLFLTRTFLLQKMLIRFSKFLS